jgi:hypothetical protein
MTEMYFLKIRKQAKSVEAVIGQLYKNIHRSGHKE